MIGIYNLSGKEKLQRLVWYHNGDIVSKFYFIDGVPIRTNYQRKDFNINKKKRRTVHFSLTFNPLQGPRTQQNKLVLTDLKKGAAGIYNCEVAVGDKLNEFSFEAINIKLSK